MTKYSFLMLAGEKEGFLDKLQELGVVDITRSVKPIDDESSLMMDKATKATKTLDLLDKVDYSKDADYESIKNAMTSINLGDDKVGFVERTSTRLAELKQNLAAAEKEMAARLPWGEYDKTALDSLEQLGYKVRYYCVEKKSFSEDWGTLYPLQIVEDNGKKVWFVTITEAAGEYNFPVNECARPVGTYVQALEESKSLSADMLECKAGLLKAKEEAENIRSQRDADLVSLDKYLASEACQFAAENMISVITGFAPVENEAELCAEFDSIGVFYIKEDAVEEDNPPIQLKNNWFTRQFECFTKMYGMPVYSEFDPTAIVAPFYLLFFSMCLGDAGYGIVLLIFGLLLNKGIVKVGMFDGLGSIISLLGAGTIVVGTVLGTFFGISMADAAWVPDFLKNIMIVGDIEVPGMGTFNIQMILAIAIGIFHICLAMTVKAICYTKRFGWKANISTWGWLILIVGGLILAILGVGKFISPAAIKWAVIILGAVSALSIYVLNTPGRNPLINIGAGLWDTYNMATGILGDVLSYIRLFALGLAGGMLGSAFNNLAGMVLGESVITYLPYVVILIFGHVLNVLMSSLGAFVHPMRLTFVEYFKNAGYEGRGTEYNPLKK
jgi:V/A-type H+-transporting ATPase subunit I